MGRATGAAASASAAVGIGAAVCIGAAFASAPGYSVAASIGAAVAGRWQSAQRSWKAGAHALPPYALRLACAARLARAALKEVEVRPRVMAVGQAPRALKDLYGGQASSEVAHSHGTIAGPRHDQSGDLRVSGVIGEA